MTVLPFFISCLLIYNFEMSGAWYFIAAFFAVIDAIFGGVISAGGTVSGLKSIAKKSPGVLSVIKGGKE